MKKRKRKVEVITVEYVNKDNEWVKQEFVARSDKEFYDWIHENVGGAGHWLIHSVRTAYI